MPVPLAQVEESLPSSAFYYLHYEDDRGVGFLEMRPAELRRQLILLVAAATVTTIINAEKGRISSFSEMFLCFV